MRQNIVIKLLFCIGIIILFSCNGKSLKFIITDSEGMPLDGAVFFVVYRDKFHLEGTFNPYLGESNVDGSFKIKNMLPINARLKINKDGYSEKVFEIEDLIKDRNELPIKVVLYEKFDN
tara:strand:+ start:637 stop:993 length:357 start_codon:yes stop_codon:yes gene_type:complete